MQVVSLEKMLSRLVWSPDLVASGKVIHRVDVVLPYAARAYEPSTVLSPKVVDVGVSFVEQSEASDDEYRLPHCERMGKEAR